MALVLWVKKLVGLKVSILHRIWHTTRQYFIFVYQFRTSHKRLFREKVKEFAIISRGFQGTGYADS